MYPDCYWQGAQGVVFKNVANTALCVHAGGVSSLEKVVKLMAKYQVGHEIVDEDACLAADCLNSFAGLYKAPIL